MYKLINYNLINDYLIKNKLSKKEFCEICKISLSTLRKMQNGANDFYMDTIYKVIKVVGCKLFDFINEKESIRKVKDYKEKRLYKFNNN